MLLVLLIASMFCQGLTAVSYGDNFITAFPENMGFFYQWSPWNSLKVTALHNDTTFTVFYQNTQKNLQILQSGQTMDVLFPNSAVVRQLGSSAASVRVTSDKNITVVSLSRLATSVQTNVVQPTVNLGTDYMIPLLDYPGYLESFDLPRLVSTSMRYSSFKLLIINAVDSQNTITVVKQTSTDVQEETFNIDSYQLVQLQTNGSVLRVRSSKEVAVILTHPCVETADCKCNMVVNQILPTKFQGRSFIVPSIFNVAETRLLVVSENSSSLFHDGNQLEADSSGLLPFSNLETSQLVKASDRVSLRLVSPGLVVELIPDTMFFACYLLQFYLQNGRAVVIAETDSKEDVRTHTGLLSASWTAIAGTNYSSTEVTIQDRIAIIWHPTSKIAVYMLEYMYSEVVFGGPAIPINEKPDLHGCVLVPGAFAVGRDPLNWTKSFEYCMNNGNQFACPVSKAVLKDMADNLTTEDGTGWIGLRRSLLTTEWYWQEEYEPSVSYVHWDDGQPLGLLKGLCASMSLDPKKEFKWQSARCCDKKKPVCYKRPACLNPSQNWVLNTVP